MIYTYDKNLPHINVDANKRGYYKLPRSILLPPYLVINQYFVDYADSIDEVFDYLIEARIDALANIRNMWVTTKASEAKIEANKMLEFTDWGGPERALVVSQVNLLGMKLSNAGVVSEGAYRAIAKFLGQYWFGKGKAAAIDFLNFCLGGGLIISRMVTDDYEHFYHENDSRIGAYVYDDPPGPWFPTTHVQIGMPLSYGVDPLTLGSFFYEICNYNLVLQSISTILNYNIVSPDSETYANIVHYGADTSTALVGSTPVYPVSYHSRVGGWTGGTGQTLWHIDNTQWPDV